MFDLFGQQKVQGLCFWLFWVFNVRQQLKENVGSLDEFMKYFAIHGAGGSPVCSVLGIHCSCFEIKMTGLPIMNAIWYGNGTRQQSIWMNQGLTYCNSMSQFKCVSENWTVSCSVHVPPSRWGRSYCPSPGTVLSHRNSIKLKNGVFPACFKAWLLQMTCW